MRSPPRPALDTGWRCIGTVHLCSTLHFPFHLSVGLSSSSRISNFASLGGCPMTLLHQLFCVSLYRYIIMRALFSAKAGSGETDCHTEKHVEINTTRTRDGFLDGARLQSAQFTITNTRLLRVAIKMDRPQANHLGLIYQPTDNLRLHLCSTVSRQSLTDRLSPRLVTGGARPLLPQTRCEPRSCLPLTCSRPVRCRYWPHCSIITAMAISAQPSAQRRDCSRRCGCQGLRV